MRGTQATLFDSPDEPHPALATILEAFPYLRPPYLFRKVPRDVRAWWHIMGLLANIQLDRLAMVRLMRTRLIPRAPTPAAGARLSYDWLHGMFLPYHKAAPGLAAMKASRIPGVGAQLAALGEIPRTREGLMAIHGIGEHIADLILAQVDGDGSRFAVDMHTKRVLPRLGLKPTDLWEPMVERESRAHLSCAITYLGRKYCRPKKPRCNVCPVRAHCPTGEKS